MGSLRHGIDKEHIGVNIEMMHGFHWVQVARDSLVHNRMEFTESWLRGRNRMRNNGSESAIACDPLEVE